MKIFYFLFGQPSSIKGMCEVAAVNKEAAREKADRFRGLFTLTKDVPLYELTEERFIELEIEYKNKFDTYQQFNLVTLKKH